MRDWSKREKGLSISHFPKGAGTNPAASGSCPPLSSLRSRPQSEGCRVGTGKGAVSTGLWGTRCCYLPLPLSQHRHGNTGPAGCSSGTVIAATVTTASSWGRGQGQGGSYFYPGCRQHSRTTKPTSTFPDSSQPLCLLSHPLRAASPGSAWEGMGIVS